jgi:hypothetical protein
MLNVTVTDDSQRVSRPAECEREYDYEHDDHD